MAVQCASASSTMCCKDAPTNLGKSSYYHTVCSDAVLGLLGNQLLHIPMAFMPITMSCPTNGVVGWRSCMVEDPSLIPGALLDACFIFLAVDALERLNIIPTWHDKAHVEGDWPLGGVREDKADVRQ